MRFVEHLRRIKPRDTDVAASAGRPGPMRQPGGRRGNGSVA
jgi:hypothetical protein